MSGGGRIGELVKKLDRMGTAQWRREVMTAMAPEVHRLVLDGFVSQRDPYGKAWAPRKKAADWAIKAFGLIQSNHPILDTGRSDGAVNRLTVRPTATGVTIRTNGYMKFHLTGTEKMVSRKWIPVDGLGTWKAPLQEVYFAKVQELMR